MQRPQPFKLSLEPTELSSTALAHLEEMRKRCSAHIILATTLAGCGHPGGSLSSLPFLLCAYALLRHDPTSPTDPQRDRIVVSHGHISPGAYAVLAEYGYFPAQEMILNFRKTGSRYAGHVERAVPGVEWGTGNLGQGLSVGAGFALAAKLRNEAYRVLVCMGDGEQQKGQIGEARRLAVKYKLQNLLAFVDRNRLQISGATDKVMPQEIAAEFRADGWNVLEFNGLDFQEIYQALRQALRHEVAQPEQPTLLLGNTVMGHGISFMENDAHYHGVVASRAQAEQALAELGIPADLDQWFTQRANATIIAPQAQPQPENTINTGSPRTYGLDVKMDNRSAYGHVLADLAKLNNQQTPRVLGITCDLAGSVKMSSFAQVSPQAFIEGGIQEHSTAALAGALSVENFVVFFSTFGVFAAAETYNQARLNDLNGTHLKIVATHVGLNVGEDGPTHQSLDYIGLFSNLPGFRIFVPADPNQTDRLIRSIAASPGNDFVAIGRSKTPIIPDEQGHPFFGGDYQFVPGQADWVRRGKDGTFIAIGPMVAVALEAREELADQGKDIGVLNMACVAPLDTAAILQAAQQGPIVTVEDHWVQSGLGIRVADVLLSNGQHPGFQKMGVSHYGSSGPAAELYAAQGLTSANLAATMRRLL